MNANIEAQLNAMLANRNAINEAINLRAGETLINADAGLTDAPSAILSIPTDSNTLYYKTDDTSAYEKLVPRGAQPMTQLISVGGMTRVETGANLLTMGVKHLSLNATYPLVFSERLPAGTYRYFEKIEYDNTMDSPEYGNRAYEAVVGAFATNYDGEGNISINTSEAFVLDKEYNVVLECGVISTGITPSVSIRYNYTGDYNDANSKDVAVTIGQATEDIICSRGETLYIWVNSNSYFYMSSSGGEIASQKLRPDTYSFTVSREFDESETAVNFKFTEDSDFTIPITVYPMIYAVPDDSADHILPTFVPFYEHLVPTPVTEIVSEGKNILPDTVYDINNWQDEVTRPHNKVFYFDIPKEGLYVISAQELTRNDVYLYVEKSIDGIYYTSTDSTFNQRGYVGYGYFITNQGIYPRYLEHKEGYKWRLWLSYGKQAYLDGVKDTVTIPDAVKNDASWGYGVKGDVRVGDYFVKQEHANTYDFSTKQFTKRVSDIVVLDGVNNKFSAGANRRFYYPGAADCIRAANAAMIVTSHFNAKAYDTADYGCWMESGFGLFYLPSTITTVEEGNAWLAEQYANGNPVKFQYALAEPIVTTITDDSYTPPKFIRTEDGGTITFENEAKEAVPSSVKYLIDLGEIV